MSKIQLIYDNSASWEKDYIGELFSNINYDIVYLDDLNLINDNMTNNILVFSSNTYSFKSILNIVLRIKPFIIVHLSDEWGNRPEYTYLAQHTKLLLHQHHFDHYPYGYFNNIYQIPLGYMTNMFNKKYGLDYNKKTLLERKYIWSFIGNIKQDRQEIINKFSNKFDKKFIGNNMSPSEMADIYNDTIFVPNGKGNIVIDCFRIYEAILTGCIPIIVCDKKEFNERFYYNNDYPPFIYEETWTDAVNKCDYLLNNTEELKNIALTNHKWLQSKINHIKSLIGLAI
jgi:hypothetical protein